MVQRLPPDSPLLVVGGVVWLDSSRLALQRRSGTAQHGAGMLEFPGGKLEEGEPPQAALMRELREEWGPAADQLRLGPAAAVLTRAIPRASDPGARPMLLMLFHVGLTTVLGPAGKDSVTAWRARVTCEPGAELVIVDRHALPLAQFMTPDRAFAEELGRAGQEPDASASASPATSFETKLRGLDPGEKRTREAGPEIAPERATALLAGGIEAWLDTIPRA